MGNGERQGRRALVDHARNAVTLANECNAAVAEAQAKHNALAHTVGADVAEMKAVLADLKKRADAQRAWLQLGEDANKSTDRRVSLLRSDVHAAVTLFRGLTFLDRLRLFLFGTFPVNVALRDFTSAWLVTPPDREVAPEKQTRNSISDAFARSQSAQAPTRHGYIPHTSRGPAVLP